MARSSAMLALALAAVLLLCHGTPASAAAKPVSKLVPARYTKGAIPFPELRITLGKFTFQKVPYFPGTTFITRDCTPHGGERRITVSSSKITFTSEGALVGGFTKIEYELPTATLKVTRGAAPALIASLYLNNLLDEESPADIKAASAAGRQYAIAHLSILRGALAPFTAKNTQDQCVALGQATGVLPYSPQVKDLVAYLNKVSAILAAKF